VPAEADGSRLDGYLSMLWPDQSRSQVQKWIRHGRVTVNGAPVKTGRRLRADDVVILDLPPPAASGPQAEDIPVHVLYQDAWIAVIDKRAGMVCHSGAGVSSGTLVNALLHQLGPIQAGDPMRPGIVHRLDKQTSGLLVVARTPEAFDELALQFKTRQVGKEYQALVYGTPRKPEGDLDWPLGRDSRNRRKFSTRARRSRTARTHYALERSVGPFALLDVRIATGRTHQIRVHLARLGHPVVGDGLYGKGRWKNLAPAGLRAAAAALQRHMLHARLLQFRHPVTGESLQFESPMPAEMQDFIALAEGKAP